VHATTVNRTDCALLQARPAIMRLVTGLRGPRSPLLGTDFVGEVASVGPEVSGYAVGDRVFGFDDSGLGSQAQYLTIDHDGNVAPMPEGVTDVEAVASIEGAHYALAFLARTHYEPGMRVCVYGATGAIGSAAVQLLVDQGSDVIAFGPGDQLDLLRGLGATTVVDHRSQDVATYEDRVDRVLDAVGKTTFGATRHLLGPEGRYASSEPGPRGQNLVLPAVTRLRRGPRVDFPLPGNIRASLLHMSRLLSEGRFRPVIDRHYPLDAVRDAYAYVLTGQKVGNVVLDVRS
jgi:NADPH:quinone reductase-like Zn-dependent oxidoreductase